LSWKNPMEKAAGEKFPANQWYYDPLKKCVYWYGPIRDLDAPDLTPPKSAPHLMIRAIGGGDGFAPKNVVDTNHVQWYHVINQGAKVMKNYPSNPTFEELLKLLGEHKATDLVVDGQEGVSLVRLVTKSPEQPYTVNIVHHGSIAIQWTPRCLMFQLTPPDYEAPEFFIALAKKYVGQQFRFELRDNIWGVMYNNNWTPIHQGLTFDTSANVWLVPAHFTDYMKYHNKITALIKWYLNSITAKRVIDAFGDSNPGEFIVFRCMGCAHVDPSHMRMHVARGDLTLFLIHLALREFGSEEPNVATWDLIKSIREYGDSSKALTDFLKIYERFLMNCLYTKGSLLIQPQQHGNYAKGWQGGKWQHSSKAHAEGGVIGHAPQPLLHDAWVESLVANMDNNAYPPPQPWPMEPEGQFEPIDLDQYHHEEHEGHEEEEQD
jgi:hypothetical protein